MSRDLRGYPKGHLRRVAVVADSEAREDSGTCG